MRVVGCVFDKGVSDSLVKPCLWKNNSPRLPELPIRLGKADGSRRGEADSSIETPPHVAARNIDYRKTSERRIDSPGKSGVSSRSLIPNSRAGA